MKLTASPELELDIKNKPFSITSKSLRKLAEALIATATFANKPLRKAIFLGSVKSLLIDKLENPELELELE